jgi:putative endonuclease
MYSVYIIYSQKIDKYYIGFSSNVQERLLKHNRNSKGFSNIGKPWILVYEETFDNKKNAMSRESQLKKWKNRERLETLIIYGSEQGLLKETFLTAKNTKKAQSTQS